MKWQLLFIAICCSPNLVKGQAIDSIPDLSHYEYFDPPGEVKTVEYPGGVEKLREYLDKHIVYPQKMLKNHIQGRVIMLFVVERDSTLTDIKALRSPSEELTEECIRVLKNAKFSPAMRIMNKVPTAVRKQYCLPIIFDSSSPSNHLYQTAKAW